MIRLLLSFSLFFANGLIALEYSKGAPAAEVKVPQKERVIARVEAGVRVRAVGVKVQSDI